MEPNYKYVWFNMVKGEFSNSWDESQQKYVDEEMLTKSSKDGWRLIKYECLNDSEFEFYNQIKLR